MALTTFEDYLKNKGLTLDIIANLADEPNDSDGLGADQLKAKFDEAGKIIATYINKTLIPEIESDVDKAETIITTSKVTKTGDTNLDGIISVNDVTTIQRFLVELEKLTDEQLALADTNGDGEVDVADATHLQMYLSEYGVVLGKQPIT